MYYYLLNHPKQWHETTTISLCSQILWVKNLNGVQGVACLPSMISGVTAVKTLMARSDVNSWGLDWSQLELLSLNV